MILTEANLVASGYRRYESKGSFPYSDYFYQKCIWEGKIKKYHINIVKYSATTFVNGTEMHESYMLEIPINKPWMTFKLHSAQDYSIEELERRVELFYTSMGCEPYEREEE